LNASNSDTGWVTWLFNKHIPIVKVPWTNHASSGATWEIKEEMIAKYPHLFEVSWHTLTRAISFKDETF